MSENRNHIVFGLTKDQEIKLKEWTKEQEALALKSQLEKAKKNEIPYSSVVKSLENGIPYYGAIGGALTYSFTPTSLGVVVSVEHAFTKNSIDLTNYGEW